MPIPFFSIPEQIQISIAQKQEFRDFVNFHKSSRESCKTANKVKTRFLSDVLTAVRIYEEDEVGFFLTNTQDFHADRLMEVPVRLKLENFEGFFLTDAEDFHADLLIEVPVRLALYDLNFFCTLKSPQCEWLINFFLATNSACKKFQFSQIHCSPEQLNHLLEAAKAEEIELCSTISSDFFTIPYINKIHALTATCLVRDRELSLLIAPVLKLYATEISSVGINAFLKEWINGQRKVTYFSLYPDATEKETIFDGITAEFVDSLNAYKIVNDKGDEIVMEVLEYYVEMSDPEADISKYKLF